MFSGAEPVAVGSRRRQQLDLCREPPTAPDGWTLAGLTSAVIQECGVAAPDETAAPQRLTLPSGTVTEPIADALMITINKDSKLTHRRTGRRTAQHGFDRSVAPHRTTLTRAEAVEYQYSHLLSRLLLTESRDCPSNRFRGLIQTRKTAYEGANGGSRSSVG